MKNDQVSEELVVSRDKNLALFRIVSLFFI